MASLLAYFGPETVMPMTSIIATIAAMVMMFGKTMFRFAFGWLTLLTGKDRSTSASHVGPHFQVASQEGPTAEADFQNQSGELVES